MTRRMAVTALLALPLKGNRAMTPEERSVSEKLAEVEKTGHLGGLEIEIWKGGGLPPPYYKSDQLRLHAVKGRDSFEFASLRFDSKFEPAAVQDKWTAAARPADVTDAARLLRSLKLLETQFGEERNPGVADGFSYELILSFGKAKAERKYYRKLPDALRPLEEFLDRAIAAAKASGKPVLFHEGREVPE